MGIKKDMYRITKNSYFCEFEKNKVFETPLLKSPELDCHQKNLTTFEARVTIRFMRIGRIHEPFYRIIAVDSRKKRDTEPLEFLGWYNPKTKEANLNAPGIKKWLSVGAKPSDTVTSLFKRAAIIKVEN